MKAGISHEISKFIKTGNPVGLANALYLTLIHRRFHELVFGIYCEARCAPSSVALNSIGKDLQSFIKNGQSFLYRARGYAREELLYIFAGDYAVHHLPTDFCGARRETIICDPNYLIIGEYGQCHNSKRLFFVTRQACIVREPYRLNHHVKHVHAVYKSNASPSLLITTGDTAKRLDLWSLTNGKLLFEQTLKKRLAGYTAITEIGGIYYFGTDFSSRPNYIERQVDGKKFFFPRPSYKMYTVAFLKQHSRYIVALNTTMGCLGKQWALSVFDTVTEQFLYCDFIADNDPVSEKRLTGSSAEGGAKEVKLSSLLMR